MSTPPIRKVLITGGRETGGLQAYALALAEGFRQLGFTAEVVAPTSLLHRLRELRDPGTLKILSTTAVFAAPLARNCICVAHGFPRPDAQGWLRTILILASLKLANLTRRCPLVAVSDYVAVHLEAVYNLRVQAAIRNPVQNLFLEHPEANSERSYITYVGRLIAAKNVHKLLPSMRRMLDQHPSLRICIAGSGPLLPMLKEIAGTDPRIEFTGDIPSLAIRDLLRKTCVFASANETEPFGITYLEALSQGCAVVMPACGGGIEIAPYLIGTQIQLMSLDFAEDTTDKAFRDALCHSGQVFDLQGYHAHQVASRYLKCAERGGIILP